MRPGRSSEAAVPQTGAHSAGAGAAGDATCALSCPHDGIVAAIIYGASADCNPDSGHSGSTFKLQRTLGTGGLVSKEQEKLPDIRISSVGATSIYVMGTVNGVSSRMLIDTGCSDTLITPTIWGQMQPQPPLEPESRNVVLADGTVRPALGACTVQMQMDGIVVQQRVVVTEVIDSVMLGLDFMEDHKMVIDMGSHLVRINGRTLGMSVVYVTNRQARCSRVQLAETTVLEPNSRTIVMGYTSKALGVGTHMVTPLSRMPGKQPVLVGKVLVRGGSRRVPIELLNATDEPVVLQAKTHAALAEPLKGDSVEALVELKEEPLKPVTTEGKQALPEELERLVQGAAVPMTDEERDQLRAVLYKRQQAFQLEGDNMGRTNLVQHDILTEDVNPIRQALRRIPIGQKEEARAEVQKTLEKART